MKKISICIPCYNEEENVINAYEVLKNTTSKNKKYYYEYIFVDNGSLDKTRLLISNLARKDHDVKGIYLSKNFGPESSGKAAFDYAVGDAVVAIGCDLQDPPKLINTFIKEWEKGSDMVMGVYLKSKESFL